MLKTNKNTTKNEVRQSRIYWTGQGHLKRGNIQKWVYWCYRHQGSQTVFNTSWKQVTYIQEDVVMSLKSMPQVLGKQSLGSHCAYLSPIQSLFPAAELLAHRIWLVPWL